MKKLTCIAIDDEPIALLIISQFCERKGGLELTTFSEPLTGLKEIARCKPDLVFLDIQMPGITGIEFARTISKKTLVIFTTAYTEYALDSYEVDAIDYLIKPVEAERFQKAVDKALSYHSLLLKEEKEAIETIVAAEYFFVRQSAGISR